MSARLEQTQRILTRAAQYDDRDGGVVAYAAWSDDVAPVDRLTAAPETGLLLDVDTWADMDAPETITVTIEPGDRLNVHDPIGSKCQLKDCPEVHDPDPSV